MSDELVCEDCGTSDNVKLTTCPYMADVCDVTVSIIICDNCYTERCMDI